MTATTIRGGSQIMTGTIPESALVPGTLAGDAFASAVDFPGTISATTGTFSIGINIPDDSLPQSKIAGLSTIFANLVHITGAETITGVKTFAVAPVVPTNAWPISATNGLQAALDSKATDSNIVHLTGTETITGSKTFSGVTSFTNAVSVTGAILSVDTSAHLLVAGSQVLTTASSIAESQVAGLLADLAAKANDNAVVHLTGNETVGGVKTFSLAPVVPASSWTIGNTSGLQSALDAKANDASVVHLAGTETVTGSKTFTGSTAFSNAVSVTGAILSVDTAAHLLVAGNQVLTTASSIAESQVAGLTADLAAKANDSAVLHKTGNETSTGLKTFADVTVTGTFTGTVGAANIGDRSLTSIKFAYNSVTGGLTGGGSQSIIAQNTIVGGSTGNIASQTITDFNIADVAIAKVTGGTLVTTIQVDGSGKFSTGTSPNARVQFDSTGIKVYDGNNVPVGVMGADGTISVTGTINATAGTFSGNLTSSATITGGVFVGGTFKTSSTVGDGTASGNGVLIDTTGVRAFQVSNASPVTTISSATGALTATGATITGAITASSGTIGGWSIGSNLTGGGLTLDSSAGAVYAGTGTTRVEMQSGVGIWAGATAFGSAPFRVAPDGTLTATNANITGAVTATSGSFTGSITATSGTVGGWSIGTNLTGGGVTLDAGAGALYAGSGTTRVEIQAGVGIWAGATAFGSAPFRVAPDGVLTATNANITGAVTATSGSFTGSITSTSGTIGGWSIGSNLTGGGLTLDSTAGAVYAGSGVTRVEMQAGVGVWAGATAFGSAPFRVAPDGTLTATNANITGAVTATSGSFTGSITSTSGTIGGWSIGTNLTGGGITLDAGAGALYSGSGTTRVEMQAGVGFWAGATTFGSAPWRVSPSGGMTAQSVTITGGSITIGANFSVASDGTLNASNGAFTGTVTATAGTIGGFTLSTTSLTAGAGASAIGMSTVNGFYAGSTTASTAPFQVDLAGAIRASSGTVGGFSLTTTKLSAGATTTTIAFDTTAGIYMGASTLASAPFSVTSAGVLKATSGTVGGFALGSFALTAGSGGSAIGVSTIDGFYAGSTSAVGAPFSVSLSGTLTATNANITGGGITGTSFSTSSTNPNYVTINSNGITVTKETTTNLVTNPSFEANAGALGAITGVTAVGGASAVATASKSLGGVYALDIYNATTTGTNGAYVAVSSTVATSATTISFYALASISNSGTTYFHPAKFQYLTSANAVLYTGSGSPVALSTTSWTRFTFTTTSFTHAAGEKVFIPAMTDVNGTYNGTGGSGSGIYIDNIQVEYSGHVTDYCDGDQPNCSWTGSRHASTSIRALSNVVDIATVGRPMYYGAFATSTTNAGRISIGTDVSADTSSGGFYEAPSIRLSGQGLSTQGTVDTTYGPASTVNGDGDSVIFPSFQRDGAGRYASALYIRSGTLTSAVYPPSITMAPGWNASNGSTMVIRADSIQTVFSQDQVVTYFELGRGKIVEARLTANTTQNIATSTNTPIVGSVSTNNGAAVAGTNLDVTFTAIAGRTYQICVSMNPFSTVANDIVTWSLTRTGTATGNFNVLPGRLQVSNTSGHNNTSIGYFYVTGTGDCTLTVNGARQSGTGNLNFGNLSTISVIDVGA